MSAWEDHVQIVKMLKKRDVEAAVTAMRDHLSSIQIIIDQLREENHSWFLDETTS
jgi:DNA-binding GntR family transcriptional regulator